MTAAVKVVVKVAVGSAVVGSAVVDLDLEVVDLEAAGSAAAGSAAADSVSSAVRRRRTPPSPEAPYNPSRSLGLPARRWRYS